jgi:hypothetical protein
VTQLREPVPAFGCLQGMSSKIIRLVVTAVPLWGAGVFFTLTGCYVPPGGAAVSVAEQDDYTYYPGYELYYSNTRHHYVYRDGNSWVTRPEPPRAFAQDLPKAPSVHVDFHDTPERHHAETIKKYPKTWKPEAAPRPESHDNDDHRDRH